jgi:hypothetical protein
VEDVRLADLRWRRRRRRRRRRTEELMAPQAIAYRETPPAGTRRKGNSRAVE